ncbi:MAG: hypothetical protein QW608_01510, partial [Thermoplasmata archaeon]
VEYTQHLILVKPFWDAYEESVIEIALIYGAELVVFFIEQFLAGGDVVSLGKNYLFVTPNGIKIDRNKIRVK